MTRAELMELLLDAGHSAAKSLEIAIDYERNDRRAIEWIATLKDMKTRAVEPVVRRAPYTRRRKTFA